MQTTDVTIRLQTLDGRWEVAGRDRMPGVDPESVTYSANDWGSDTASFTLKRSPGDIFPDISAFTPVEIEIGGVLVWSGRVRETPSKEGSDAQINVNANGWQYHLDDDVYRYTYVHTRVADYQDMRTAPSAVLGNNALFADASVANDNGVITLSYPKGTSVTAGSYVGVYYDFGPISLAKRIVLVWDSSNNTGGLTFYARAADSSDAYSWPNGHDAFTFTLNSGATGTSSGTFATPHRYVQLFIHDAGYTGAIADDHWVKIKSIQVFADTAYESGGSSIIKASDIARDAISKATVFIGNSKIQSTSFNLPEFSMTEDKTPREVITAVNAYHDYVTLVDTNKDFILKPKPATPLLTTGAWLSEFDDSSTNSGEEIYNRVIITGTAPNGTTIRFPRHTEGPINTNNFGQLANPSATTNINNWTTGFGSLSRDTGVYDTSPASFKASVVSPGGLFLSASDTVTQSVFKGQQYEAIISVRRAAGLVPWWDGNEYVALEITDASFNTIGYFVLTGAFCELIPSTQFMQIRVKGTAPVNSSGYKIRIWVRSANTAPSNDLLYFDSIQIGHSVPTILDKRNFIRTKVLPVQHAITPTSASQIAQIFLDSHKLTPFKGSFNATSHEGVRKTLGGEGVAPHALPLYTNELINFGHVVNPDTGGMGRDGRIASVTYRHASRSAEVSIDSQRKNFETFLERLSLVTGAATQS